jgi:hypothetical protein
MEAHKQMSTGSPPSGDIHLHNGERPLGWSTAIEDAQAEIEKCKRKVARLRAAIRVFRQRLEEKEPFPGCEQTADLTSAKTTGAAA